MILEDLGYTNKLENYRIENNLLRFGIARVTTEHKKNAISLKMKLETLKPN